MGGIFMAKKKKRPVHHIQMIDGKREIVGRNGQSLGTHKVEAHKF